MSEHLPECWLAGEKVTVVSVYKNGLALVCICERLRAAEQRGREDERKQYAAKWYSQQELDAAVAAARAEEQELRIADASNGIGHWIDCPTERHDVTAIYRAGLADGVKAAREAVEVANGVCDCPRIKGEDHGEHCPAGIALAAIDGVKP